MLLPCIGIFLLIDMFRQYSSGEKTGYGLRNISLFVAGFCLLLYIAWPILWSSPVHYFVEEFRSLAHINWGGQVLFLGKMIDGAQLPWTYVPVWFAITMPEVWLFAGLAGAIWIICQAVRYPNRFLVNAPQRQFILYLLCLLGPVFMVIVLHSVNYDDWRHLYFIYPSFVMLALFFINKLISGRSKIFVYVAYAIQFILVAFFIVSEHPLEYVYFNRFVSHADENIHRKFDMEYWGIGYRRGLEYILAHDTASSIRVSNGAGPIYDNVGTLTKDQRKRVIIVAENENPDYFITVFRYHPEDYDYYHNIIYNYKISNSSVLRIYKVH